MGKHLLPILDKNLIFEVFDNDLVLVNLLINLVLTQLALLDDCLQSRAKNCLFSNTFPI